MEDFDFIPAHEFCAYYQVDSSFVNLLEEYGLVEVSRIGQREYIHPDKLRDLEKFMRLHFDLDINVEGIDVIHRLQERISQLQGELLALKNRLRLYE